MASKLDYTSINLLFNPVSTGDAVGRAEKLYKQLKGVINNIPIRRVETKYAGHDEKLAYKLACETRRPLIVSVSGDGGFNNVINGAVRSADVNNTMPICAVHGAGNANDNRRTLKELPMFEAIMSQNSRDVDLLRIEFTLKSGKTVARYAHSYAGLGLTPEVAVELNKQALTPWRELLLTIQTFAAFEPFVIELPDGSKPEYDSLLFGNIDQMAKVVTLSKNSTPDDGKFELIATPHVSKVRLLGVAAKAAVVGFDKQTSINEFEFKVVKALPMQLDGEVVRLKAGNNVRVAISPRKLRMLV